MKNPKADAFFAKAKKWRPELKKLRTIVLACGLKEEIKWGKPTYTFDDANVVILIPLKDHLALAFTKGALLKDSKHLLSNIGRNQASRWIKFASLAEVTKREAAIKSYIREAVKVQKSGAQIRYKETSEYEVPEEFGEKLSKNAALRKAFEALTPGRQRGYLIYFSGAKQSKTRAERVEKCAPMILKGKGLMDDSPYRRR